jgi:hypothetical protein
MISQSEKTNPISEMAKMNVILNTTKDYGNFRLYGPKKTNPNKPNFKRDNGFSPQVRLGTPYGGVPGTAYYTRDCHVTEFTLSAAEGGLAITFLGALLQMAASLRKTLTL